MSRARRSLALGALALSLSIASAAKTAVPPCRRVARELGGDGGAAARAALLGAPAGVLRFAHGLRSEAVAGDGYLLVWSVKNGVELYPLHPPGARLALAGARAAVAARLLAALLDHLQDEAPASRTREEAAPAASVSALKRMGYLSR